MKQQVRELLVTAKVAQKWQDTFDKNVDDLMAIVNKVDTDKTVQEASQLLDVYRKSSKRPAKLKKKRLSDCCEKPFEFLVFSN